MTQTKTAILMTEEPRRRNHLNKNPKPAPKEVVNRRRQSLVKAVRWELFQPTPSVMFSIGYASGGGNYEFATSAIEHETLHSKNWGKWSCIAMTYEASARKSIQYVNGDRIGELSLDQSNSLLLDYMTLGNFSVSEVELQKPEAQGQRRFYGAFDELVVAKRIFSDKEIRQIWSEGQP